MTNSRQVNGRKAPLTPQRIVGAAVRLADQHGLEQLTMRGLAAHLDTGPMSLYNHVANRDSLIDEMVDHIVDGIDLPTPSTPWKAAARAMAIATHDTLEAHSWAITPWSTRTPGLNRYRLMEALLESLACAGLPTDIADLGFHAIINHLQSSAQRPEVRVIGPRDYENAHRGLDRQQFPRVVEHIHFHQAGNPAHDEFAFVLDLILDGLEKTADSTSSGSRLRQEADGLGSSPSGATLSDQRRWGEDQRRCP